MDWFWLVIAAFLYLIVAALIIAEVFIPSGGIISVFAVASFIAGTAIFFRYSMTAGVVGIVLAMFMIPSVLTFAYKMLPKTRFGKVVILSPSDREKGDAIPDTAELKGLMGQTGVVLTPLRPVGMCDFDSKRVECVAESGYVGKEKHVQVIKVEGTQLTVRIIDNS